MSGQVEIQEKSESAQSAKVHIGTKKEKRCRLCGETKAIDLFPIRKGSKDGYRNDCIECRNKRSNEWYLKNAERQKEKQREWNKLNKDKKNQYSKQWYQNNKERARELAKKWEEENKERYLKRRLEYQRKYSAENKEKIRSWAIERRKRNPEKFYGPRRKWADANREKLKELNRLYSAKIRSTPHGKLDDRMSAGIRASLKNSKAGFKWESLTGYTVSDLKKHIEKKFTEGMTWEKFMNGEIHIDHIIPKSRFNYEKPEDIDFKRCWSLKNLRPLWAKDNLSKHDKLEKPFQPSLIL